MLSKRIIVLVAVACSALGCGGDSLVAPGQPQIASKPTAATALALGSRFSCALTAAGQANCWGANGQGQMGDSSVVATQNTPLPTSGNRVLIAIAAGESSVCALDTSGTPWCWGEDPALSVFTSNQLVPAAVAGAPPLTSITVGRRFACGLDQGGTAYCWGENGKGQLGVGDTTRHTSPTKVLGGLHFASLAAGFWSICGLDTTGQAYCWGDGSFGQGGGGDTQSPTAPRAVIGGLHFRALSGGATHNCAIEATTSAAYCWGANASGQLGNGADTPRASPTPVLGGLTFSAIRSHRGNSVFGTTCAVTTGGDVYCWGWNDKGQMGSPPSATTESCTAGAGTVTQACSYRPLKVNGVSGAISVDVGLEHACAILAGGSAVCWGTNGSGQLGDGTGTDSPTPVVPKGGLKFP